MTTIHDRARWFKGRAGVLALIRGSGEPSESEVIDALWAKQLESVAAAMERELYPRSEAPCRCDNPICPKVHPVDMGVIEPGDPRHPWAPEVRYPVPANPMYEGMD